MYTNGSTEFNTAIETPNNKAVKKRIVFTDSGAIIDKFKTLVLHSSSNTSELQIGTTNMSYLDIELFTDTPIYNGQTFTLECGVELEDGSVEYAPMGVFTAQNVKREVDTIKFVANDNMQKLEKLHTSSLTYPTTSDRIVEEICDLCGIELETPIDNPITVSEKLQGYTCREMIGFIAGIQGKFACFGRNGRLNLRWYSDSPIEIKTGLIWAFTHSQDTFAVGKIEIAKDTETKFTSGDGINAILHSNPLATQQISDNIFAELNGFSYSTCNIKMLDDIRLDIWDMVKVNYFDGNTYLIPCMSIRQDMGASSTQIEAFSKSSTENQYRYTGATTQYLNRLATEILITNRVVSEKVDAEYVQAHAITTDNLEAIEADIKVAVIGDLSSKFISVDNLDAIKADIKVAVINDLSADLGKITILESEVADINTLIFGSATGNVIQTQFANSVIAQLGDAQIKSAMIQDVSASKITAGTIYTDDVTIQSKNGQMKLKDNTIQISDGKRARVQIGKDASNDYSINIWDKDGNLMFSQGGITDKAIKSAIIRNDMVSDTANISATKLDISSLFTEINNNNSNTIKATKIYLDEESQTLDVSFKSMTTTVDGIVQTQTSQGTQLEVLNGKISSKIWQQDITTAIDNVDIGGRNLILDSVSIDFNVTTTSDTTNKNVSLGKFSDYFFEKREVGIQLTLSFDWETTGTQGTFVPQFNNTPWSGFSGSAVRVSSTNNKGRYEYTITLAETAVADTAKYTGLFVRIDKIDGTTKITNIKCEFGNKATDWTPAPEDVESEITTLSTKYSTLEQDVSGFKTTVSATYATKDSLNSVNTSLTDKYSTLQQDVNSFKTTVSNTYTTKTEFDNLTIGGRNLIINSSKYRKDNPISLTSNLKDGVYTSSDMYMPIEVGETYTFQCCTDAIWGDHRTDGTGTGWVHIYLYLQTKEYDINNNGFKRSIALINDPTLGLTGRQTWTYTIPNDGNKYVRIKFRFDIHSDGNTTYTAKWWDIKAEKGNKATDWTPAPEDVESEITTLSTKYSTLEQDVSGFKTTVSATYATKDNLSTSISSVQTQTAEKFAWLVKSGTSSTNFTLTDRMIAATAEKIKITGDMIVDGAVTANKINVSDLFAQEITVNGKFKAIGSVWIPPAKEDIDLIRKSINGEITLTTAQKTAFDFDVNGKVDLVDFAICKSAILHDLDIPSNYPEYTPTNSDINVTINPKNPKKIISMTTTNSFGRAIDIFFGLDGMSVPKINTSLVDTYDILLQGKQLSNVVDGIEYSNGIITASGVVVDSVRTIGSGWFDGDVIANYGTTTQVALSEITKIFGRGNTTATNANEIISTCFLRTANTTTNVIDKDGYLLTFGVVDRNAALQFNIPYNASAVYLRSYWYGSWSSWRDILNG